MRIKAKKISAVGLAIAAVAMLAVYGGSASGSPAHSASGNAAGAFFFLTV